MPIHTLAHVDVVGMLHVATRLKGRRSPNFIEVILAALSAKSDENIDLFMQSGDELDLCISFFHLVQIEIAAPIQFIQVATEVVDRWSRRRLVTRKAIGHSPL